jgi:hydroxymethylglutaryl-CoA reductase (NADPH)
LDTVYVAAKSQKQETIVTILSPIKYKLEYPSVHEQTFQNLATHSIQELVGVLDIKRTRVGRGCVVNSGSFDIEYTDQFLDAVGGKVLESLLKSVEDPITLLSRLSKTLPPTASKNWSVYSISNEPESVGAA